MRGQLEKIAGVVSADVDFDTQTAIVTIKPTLDPKKLLAGLSGAYSGEIKN